MLTEEQQSRVEQPAARPRSQVLLRRYGWWVVGVALIAASFGIVRWAGTRPGYDPYGWLIWGYQAIHGSLSLNGAPSFKPLPLIVTAPAALFGHYQLWIWMTVAVAASLAGCLFAGRIAYRIVDRGGQHRWPAACAAIFAGVGLLLIFDNEGYSYLHYVLSVQSDPPIVSCVLAGIDLALIRRKRWAIAMFVLASLGRPETWPFLGLYGLWCWREFREMRWFVAISFLIVPLAWFGIPEITNHNPFVAANLAQGSPRELHGSKITGTIGRFKDLNMWPIWVAAGIGVAWAAYRRDRIVLGLLAGVVLWVLVEIAFALHGWPGVPRYLFEPAAVSIVIGAVAFGWLLSEIPHALKLPWWPGLIVAAAITAAVVPNGITRARAEHAELKGERLRTTVFSREAGFINVLGGRRALLACGTPVVNVEFASLTGWLLHRNTDQIAYKTQFMLRQASPSLFLTALPNGWAAYLWHPRPGDASCVARDRVLWIFTPHHPGGAISPNRTPPKLGPYTPPRKK